MFRFEVPYILGILLQRDLEKNLYNSYGEVLRVGFYTVIIASIYWELILYQILFLILFMY